MGISYDELWNMNPRKMLVYQKVYQEQENEKYQQMDFAAWLSGLYVQRAFGSCLERSVKYPNDPLFLATDEQETDEVGEPVSDAERFEMWALKYNQQRKKKD